MPESSAAISGTIVRDQTYALTLGFGTTVAMWTVGYLCRMPPAWVPSWLLLFLLLACLFLGGFTAGRHTRRGWRAGLRVGILASTLNMLILGSLLTGDRVNQVVPSALWWVPGSVLAGALLGSFGAGLGAAFGAGRGASGLEGTREINWTAGFSIVAALATLLLLIVGGLVTSNRAGLAVVDWPNSSGYYMFLYPISRMTGGVYYEHAHRLFASLVGLTTLVLAIHLWRVEPRRWVRRFALAAFALVVVQGLLGGLRVTGHFTTSTSPDLTRPSIGLAIAHGVAGQLFFASLVALAAFTSTLWRSSRAPAYTPGAPTDRSLGITLVAMLLVQLVLGAVLRHISKGLLIHLTMAAFVLVLVIAAGVRAAAIDRGQPLLARLGRVLLLVAGLQVLLGIGALVVDGIAAGAVPPPTYRVLVTTAHQANGATLLALGVLLAVWNHRLLRPVVDRKPAWTG